MTFSTPAPPSSGSDGHSGGADRHRTGRTPGDPTGGPAGPADQVVGTTLEQVRQNAAALLAGMARPPRTLHVRAGDVSIDIEWPEQPAPAAAAAAVTPAVAATGQAPAGTAPAPGRVLTAPAVGVFYRAPEPGADPFVSEGDTVTVGQQVAIVETMKLMIPVEAELAGRIVEVLKKDGEPVEYGEALFALAPENE
jgi:acetyl-CoA carboxylase biotin carboxyl carrier protein